MDNNEIIKYSMTYPFDESDKRQVFLKRNLTCNSYWLIVDHTLKPALLK